MSCYRRRYELKFRRTPGSLGSVSTAKGMGTRSHHTAPHHRSV
nr:unnamed protein product [Callosobruchus analis]